MISYVSFTCSLTKKKINNAVQFFDRQFILTYLKLSCYEISVIYCISIVYIYIFLKKLQEYNLILFDI